MLLSTAHRSAFAAAFLLVLTAGLLGCRIENRHTDDGKHNVSIQTPLGGLDVKTDTPGVLSRVGLPAYPGSTQDKKKNNDSGSADVNMSFGDFRLRVLAAGYTTPDSPEQVRSFYRKSLAQYGDVLECRDEQPVGSLKRTGQGLTCANDNRVHTSVSDDDHTERKGTETELKAGSPSRQHIVSFEARDGGTHFGLVSLELPHGLGKS